MLTQRCHLSEPGNKLGLYWATGVPNIYRRWGDKTSSLKNVKCSGEPKKHGCHYNEWDSLLFTMTVALSFQIEMNLDRTNSSFLATSLYKKVIFFSYKVSDDMM